MQQEEKEGMVHLVKVSMNAQREAEVKEGLQEEMKEGMVPLVRVSLHAQQEVKD